MPADVASELFEFRYREKFRLSTASFAQEPAEELIKAGLIWQLDAERDKLEADRQAAKGRS